MTSNQSTSIRPRSGTFVSDGCPINVSPNVFATCDPHVCDIILIQFPFLVAECPPSSYPCAASQSYGSLPETEQSFSFCDQVSFFENFRSHMMTSGSPSGYSSEGSIPGSPRSPLSSSMSSCSDLESEVMSSGEVAGSAPTPSVTASEKGKGSREEWSLKHRRCLLTNLNGFLNCNEVFEICDNLRDFGNKMS